MAQKKAQTKKSVAETEEPEAHALIAHVKLRGGTKQKGPFIAMPGTMLDAETIESLGLTQKAVDRLIEAGKIVREPVIEAPAPAEFDGISRSEIRALLGREQVPHHADESAEQLVLSAISHAPAFDGVSTTDLHAFAKKAKVEVPADAKAEAVLQALLEHKPG